MSPHFTDRVAELARLADVLAEKRREQQDQTAVLALVGQGGIGKTAIATQFLTSVGAQYPDGTLYADMGQGDDPSPVLDGFLRALGVPAAEVPVEFGQRAAFFRSRTHGRRLALLVENATTAAQVRALRPGVGSHLVVVATRNRLTGLAVEGAEFVDVRPLEPEWAVRLLGALIGPPDDRAPDNRPPDDRAPDDGLRDDRADVRGRDDRTPDVAAQGDSAATSDQGAADVSALCDHTPLALCAAAGRIRMQRHRSLERVAGELRDERRRLALLSRQEDLSVRSALDISYRRLPADTARFLRLLGLHPGADFDARAGAALAGIDEFDAEYHVEALTAASLIEETSTETRYRLHDLVRLFAREKSAEDPEEGDAALDRLFAYYLRVSAGADLTLNSGRWHVGSAYEEIKAHGGVEGGAGSSEGSSADGGASGDRESALAWFDAELPNLQALVRLAHDHRPALAWQLCETLWAYFVVKKPFVAWLETHRYGEAAARTEGDPLGEARMASALTVAHLNLLRFDDAEEYAQRALDLWHANGHRLGEAAACEQLSTSLLARGRVRDAIEHLRHAEAIHEDVGVPYYLALIRRYLAEAHSRAEEYTTALDYFARSLAYFEQAGDNPYQQSRTLSRFAATLLAMGRPEEAAERADAALAAAAAAGAEPQRAESLGLLGRSAAARGRKADAHRFLTGALGIYAGLGDPHQDEIRRLLGALGEAEG
ncbi:tetratricopeptide repeat protein [Murinocardiopsis flavida]|uniref:tetratricopeptide repeat protein n=1 Tax=Murinocardiopsis flavida TaxID=645275 RepID=UPI000D0D1CD2|nr:tetratricopeptide repeat protein [Murinocardiopsis flavida]